MVEGFAWPALETSDRLAQLSFVVTRLAAGSQRFQPSGPRLRRSRRQQESRYRPCLFSARCQYTVMDYRPLLADLRSYQRDRCRQATLPAMADNAAGRDALRRRHRNLALGWNRNRRPRA